MGPTGEERTLSDEKQVPDEQIVKELKEDRSFFGHPKAIATLGFLDMCAAFSNYGMSAILVYYLYAEAPTGLGLAQMEAVQLISLYTAATTLAGLVGSYVADRILGPRRAIGISRIMSACAFTLLAIPSLGTIGYALSQALLCFAGMCVGRSSDALTRKMYDLDDERCDGAFGIRYVINNIGAMVPALTGAVAASLGYSAAFGVCAVVSIAGALEYFVTQKKFFGPIGLKANDPMPVKDAKRFLCVLVAVVLVAACLGTYALASRLVSITTFTTAVSFIAIFVPVFYFAHIIRSKKCTPAESRSVLYLVPLFICGALTCVVFEQANGVLAVYVETTVDRMIFGVEVPAAAFSTFGALFSILFGSIFTAVWSSPRKQPTSSAKLALGSAIYVAAPLLMCLPFVLYPAGSKVSCLWIIGFWLISMFGEAISVPVGFSVASKVAPAAYSTQMIMVWALQVSFGSGVSAILANFYQEGSEALYFLLLGGICLVCCCVVLAFSNKIERGLGLMGEGE